MVDSSETKEALCVAAEWRCRRAPFSQSHAIVLSSAQPTATEPAVIESLRPSRTLSDPGTLGVLMGKQSELGNGV